MLNYQKREVFILSGTKRYSVINGAFLLALAAFAVRIIGMLYKIPLTNLIGAVGRGYFSTAYNIFTPVYAISMAGLPIAISRLVSQNMAAHRYGYVKGILRVSLRCFAVTGVAGFLILLAAAYPYAKYIARTPNAVYSIVMLAPSVLFCCIISAFRGYYEGQSNMYPTAISQLIEALGRMSLGLGAAYAVMKITVGEYESAGTVFGRIIPQGEDVMSIVYPYTAAAAVSGATLGALLSMIYLILRHKIKGENFTNDDLLMSPQLSGDGEIFSTMLKFSLPVMIGTLILNLVNIVDSATIQNRLAYAIGADSDLIRTIYNMSSDVQTSDISAYLYGCYNAAMDFKNLIPTITFALGVSALPALAAAWEQKSRRSIENTVSMVTRLTVFISLPAGFGLAVMSKPILSIVYSGSQSDIVNAATPTLSIYSAAMVMFALSAPTISMLHAIGDMTTPIKSLVAGSGVKIVLNLIFVGMPRFNINGAIFGTLASTVIIVIYNLTVLLRKTGVKLNVTAVFLKPFFASVLSALGAYGCHFALSNHIGNPLATAISVIISIIIYIFVTFLVRGIYANDIKMFSFGEKIAKALEKYEFLR